jgi:hypothetical protein
MTTTWDEILRYNFDKFPAWKQYVWQELSKEAKSRGAFPKDHYEDEILKPYFPPYQEMYRWLVSRCTRMHRLDAWQ